MPRETGSAPNPNTSASTPQKYGDIARQEVIPEQKLEAVRAHIEWLQQEIEGRGKGNSPMLERELEILQGRDTENLNREAKKYQEDQNKIKDGRDPVLEDEINAELLDWELKVNTNNQRGFIEGKVGPEYGRVLPRKYVSNKIHPHPPKLTPVEIGAAEKAKAAEVLENKIVNEFVGLLITSAGDTVPPLDNHGRTSLVQSTHQEYKKTPDFYADPGNKLPLAINLSGRLFDQDEPEVALYAASYAINQCIAADLRTITEADLKVKAIRQHGHAAGNFIISLVKTIPGSGPDYSFNASLSDTFKAENQWIKKQGTALSYALVILSQAIEDTPESTDEEKSLKEKLKVTLTTGEKLETYLESEGMLDDINDISTLRELLIRRERLIVPASATPLSSTTTSPSQPVISPRRRLRTAAMATAPASSAASVAPATPDPVPATAVLAPATPEAATPKSDDLVTKINKKLETSTAEEEVINVTSAEILEFIKTIDLPRGVKLDVENSDCKIANNELKIKGKINGGIVLGGSSIKLDYVNDGTKTKLVYSGSSHINLNIRSKVLAGSVTEALKNLGISINNQIGVRTNDDWEVKSTVIDGDHIVVKLIKKRAPVVTSPTAVASPAPVAPITPAVPASPATPSRPRTPAAPIAASVAVPASVTPDTTSPATSEPLPATAVLVPEDVTREPLSTKPRSKKRSLRWQWPGKWTTRLLAAGALSISAGIAVGALGQTEPSTTNSVATPTLEGTRVVGSPAERRSSPIPLERLSSKELLLLKFSQPDANTLSYLKNDLNLTLDMNSILDIKSEITNNQGETIVRQEKGRLTDFISAKALALRLLVQNHPDFKDIKVTNTTDLYGDSEEAKKYRQIYNAANVEKRMEYDYVQRLYFGDLTSDNLGLSIDDLPARRGKMEKVILLRRVEEGRIIEIKVPKDTVTYLKNAKTQANDDYNTLIQKGQQWSGFEDSYR